MIANEQQLRATLERIAWFQQQIAYLRQTEANTANYQAAASGFLAEIDRMQLEVRRFGLQPREIIPDGVRGLERRTLQQLESALAAVASELSGRVEELARKSSAGTLSEQEHEEYAEIVRMNDVLSALRAQAADSWSEQAQSP